MQKVLSIEKVVKNEDIIIIVWEVQKKFVRVQFFTYKLIIKKTRFFNFFKA